MEGIFIEAIVRDKGPDSILTNIRNDGFVPGILYGSDHINQTIQINKRNLLKQLKTHGKTGLFTILVDGNSIPIKVNEIQRNPLDGEIIHVDLQRINMDKVIHMPVPIHLFGESEGVKSGGTIQQELREVEVRALPTTVPESIHVNISDLKIGDALFVRELSIPNEVELLTDENSVILTILHPKMAEQEEGTDRDIQSEPEIVDARDGRGIDAAK